MIWLIVLLLAALVGAGIALGLAWRDAAREITSMRAWLLDHQTCVTDPYARPAPAEERTP